MKLTLIIVLAAALVGAFVGAGVGLGLGGNSGSGPALSPERLYRLDARGVVAITRTTREGTVSGSGFVINKRGDILTDDHVALGSAGIRVAFSGGASYPARVVGTDRSRDLAVVRVIAPTSALHPLRLDDSSAVAVGDPVYAIGDPPGLGRTMTAGIVSATGRDVRAPDGVTVAKAIRTDAAIDRGSSGGPLIDRFGRVIAVTTESGSGNAGVALAIPSNTARTVATELINRGRGHARPGANG